MIIPTSEGLSKKSIFWTRNRRGRGEGVYIAAPVAVRSRFALLFGQPLKSTNRRDSPT